MGELKGSVVATTIFVAVIVPFLLMITIGGLHQFSFMKHTTEITQIVSEEGGVTGKVTDVVNDFESRGYNIKFTDENGNSVSGKQEYGDIVVIDYEYKYGGVRGEEVLNTQNLVTITRR